MILIWVLSLTSYRTFLKGLHFILMCTGRSSIFLQEIIMLAAGKAEMALSPRWKMSEVR